MKKIVNLIQSNRLINQFLVLLTGEGIVSILNILSLGIILKAIGLENNGIILSLQTFCLLFNNIFGFKSFQALIKYLSISIYEEDLDKTKSYIYQSYALDIIAVIIATIFSILFLKIYSNFMGWTANITSYAPIFIFAYLFQVQGAATGILRVYDKFNYITYSNVIVNIIRFVLYSIGLFTESSLNYFIVVEAILLILPNIILNYYALKTLKEYGLNDFYRYKFKIEKEFFKFNLYSNISSTIDIPVGTLTTIVINKYLGYELISVYKIFEKLGGLINKLGSPLNQIIYPEMNSYIAKKDFNRARKLNQYLFWGLNILGVIILTITAVTYKMWLGWFIDNPERYIISLLFYFTLIIFINSTVGVHSLFMALNYIKYNIYILLVINIIYLSTLLFFIKSYALNGVILALLLQAIAVIVVKMYLLIKNNFRECSN